MMAFQVFQYRDLSTDHTGCISTIGKTKTSKERAQVMEERIKQAQLESLITARQVAEFLQVSVSTVGRWSRQGAIKFYRVGGRGDMRYRVEDVFRFLEDTGAHPEIDAMGESDAILPRPANPHLMDATAGPVLRQSN